MSFTGNVKQEISSIERMTAEKISALSAMIYNSEIYPFIKITTENAPVARLIFKLFKDLYDVTAKITVRKGYNFKKNLIYILEIKEKKDLILKDLGIGEKEIPSFLYDDDDLKRAYLSGVFLLTGSVNDPKTSRYHLEMIVNDLKYAEFIQKHLNDYYLNAKVIKKENKYMIYIKEAEKISDFLRIMKAMNAVMYFEDIRIYRDHKNMTNRLNNCEQANVDKMIETSYSMVKSIELLKEKNMYDLLDEKVKEAAEYRCKYPEVSLLELSEIISIETGNQITKSGLHHRLKKIEILVKKVRD